MKLYVDIGNTTIKWATAEELQHNLMHRAASSELPKMIEQAWLAMEMPDAVHIASVRNRQIDTDLLEWIEHQWRLTPVFAQTRRQEHGVTNGYEQPAQLGVDRWLAMLAARAISPSPLIVVDCGSAMTVDAMDADGRHIGGIIVPGMRLLSDSLLLHTDIPPHDAGEICDYFATDTASGILTGSVVALSATVEKLYHRLQQHESGDVRCVISGGDAQYLTGYLELPHEVEPALVLKGLLLQAG
jgi:type III pantothenate kinase